LNGDLEDYQGTIKLDGLDYKIIDKGKLQSIIATISQFPYLFNDSLKENLKMNREITDEKLEKVLKEVKAEDFLKGKLTNKFDNNLSGGQQQRVAIARELLGKKPILIMDESTASLDKLTALAV
ncbi:MAG TPA: ABC transporter ATP-binding protein, partial [Lactococcus lactis]|nr:ABC transporter ATP-binding protein [Lactococcus lactis]